MSDLDERVRIDVTRREALELCAGLRAYVRYMQQHAADDESGAHTPDQLDRLQVHFGQLIWRLEEAALPPGSGIVHSEDAVPPGSDDTSP